MKIERVLITRMPLKIEAEIESKAKREDLNFSFYARKALNKLIDDFKILGDEILALPENYKSITKSKKNRYVRINDNQSEIMTKMKIPKARIFKIALCRYFE